MATKDIQLQQAGTRAGTGAARQIATVALVVGALGVGALIGRSTSPATKTDTAVRPATAISLTGWATADAARRAQIYETVTAPTAISLDGWATADAARRAQVYRVVTAETPFTAIGPSITDAQRRALVNEIVTGG
jgi:hypothetical protein